MGSKQTKIEGSYISDSPISQQIQLNTVLQNYGVSTEDSEKQIKFNEMDPRSPSGHRTPICFPKQRTHQLMDYQQNTPVSFCENHLVALRKRILKGFTYSLNDPRSPSSELNRTPLVFDEKDRTFNMNDTFADLFVETRIRPECENLLLKSENQVEMEMQTKKIETDQEEKIINDSGSKFIALQLNDEETMPCPAVLPQTPKSLQQDLQTIDPRSPTLGVERTPILINDDDDEANEDAMLENILATLSLNLSSASNISVFSTSDTVNIVKPKNKHLERVRNGKRRTNETKSARPRQRIYKDNDVENSPTTPKQKKLNRNISGGDVGKRTPLSCVKNRSYTRSRSVEMLDKSKKTKLLLSSYDDNLNPKDCSKISSLRIIQDTKDAMEL